MPFAAQPRIHNPSRGGDWTRYPICFAWSWKGDAYEERTESHRGAAHPIKDHALPRAFALVAGERTARLIIIGEGVERGRLLALAHELGIADLFDLPGFQRDPFAWMARARVFAMSSLLEGASRPRSGHGLWDDGAIAAVLDR